MMSKGKNQILATVACWVALATSCDVTQSYTEKILSETQRQRIIANPLELNYRFQFDDPSYREAADPVLEYFKGKYYLFASKSGGYWSSEDLCKWTYIPCKSLKTIEHYAPTILVYNDSLYFMSSTDPTVFRTANPDEDNWEAIDTHFKNETEQAFTDPAFFKDDNGKVYLYWGCSDKDPIIGVEVDPQDGFRAIGSPKTLILHNIDKYGWEVPGDHNEEQRIGWNEGPCMIKRNGKYYLHYAAPGTQYRIYGDGVYVSENPLGPFVYQESNPFSFKPGGFIGGAGHGHTFLDKYGNYWHVATMKISVRHMFERRLGLFPVYFDDNQDIHTQTTWTDYPFIVPDKKVDFSKEDGSLHWNMLSYGKAITASSMLSGYEADRANDEQIETWWSATTGKSGEWLQLDLGEKMSIYALQVNFADQDFMIKASNSFVNYQYVIECSDDGKKWTTLVDQTTNNEDLPHDLLVLPSSVKSRYVRIVNKKDMDGKFSISDFRIFGHGNGQQPKKVEGLTVSRDSLDKRKIRLDWNAVSDATGYVVRWGVSKDQLNNSTVVYDNTYEACYYNRDSEYYFSIDAFNENGVTKGVLPNDDM